MTQYTLTAQERAAGEWLTAVLPALYTDRIVAADQRGTRLEHPFATFKFIDDVGLSATASTQTRNVAGGTPGTFVREIRATRRATLSVNVYGPTAYADLRSALLKFQAPSVVEDARTAGLSIQSAGSIRRLPGDGQTTREDRAQCDFVVLYVDALDVDQEAVEQALGSGSDDLDGTTVDVTF